MSQKGHSRPKWTVSAMSGLPPAVTELQTSLVVRFVPKGECQLLSFHERVNRHGTATSVRSKT